MTKPTTLDDLIRNIQRQLPSGSEMHIIISPGETFTYSVTENRKLVDCVSDSVTDQINTALAMMRRNTEGKPI